MKPTLLHPAPVTPDLASRIALQDRALSERKEAARRDVAGIIQLWQTKQYQRKHTEGGEPKGAA